MKPPAEDLPARAPVWEAMSDWYLDTDPAPLHAQAARTLAASPYSVAELRDILVYEVNPVLWRNLFSVAGVWQGFCQDWLRDEILRRQKRPRAFRRLLPQPVLRRDWRAMVPLIETLRSTGARRDTPAPNEPA